MADWLCKYASSLLSLRHLHLDLVHLEGNSEVATLLLDAISNLTQLQTLSLANFEINKPKYQVPPKYLSKPVSFPGITSLSNLTSLKLSRVALAAPPSDLSALSKLKDLQLSPVRLLNEPAVDWRCRAPEELGSHICASSLVALTSLKSLSLGLSAGGIGYQARESLGMLTQLKQVQLQHPCSFDELINLQQTLALPITAAEICPRAQSQQDQQDPSAADALQHHLPGVTALHFCPGSLPTQTWERPESVAASIARLPYLRHLRCLKLTMCNLELGFVGLSELVQLTCLHLLDVSRVPIGAMHQLSCLTSLMELKVRPVCTPYIADNAAASRFPSQYLPVLGTTLTEITSLEVTKCVEDQVDGSWLPVLQKFQRLQELVLWHDGKSYSADDPLQLQALPSLTTLKLLSEGSNHRIDVALAQLTQLQSLTVVGRYSMTSALRFTSLINLRHLCLKDPRKDVLHLRKQVTRLRRLLYCSGCLLKIK